jgi:hypothetical protein
MEPFFGIWNADRAILAAAAIVYELTSLFSCPTPQCPESKTEVQSIYTLDMKTRRES